MLATAIFDHLFIKSNISAMDRPVVMKFHKNIANRSVWLITESTASARIGTHRHASAPNLTTSTRQNRGWGIKVQFQSVNIWQTAGRVSKQIGELYIGAPPRQDETTSSQGAGQSLNAPKTNLTKGFTKKLTKSFNCSLRSGGVSLPVISKLFINPIFESINTISLYSRIR